MVMARAGNPPAKAKAKAGKPPATAKGKAGKPPATAKGKAGKKPAAAKLPAAAGETVIALDIPSAGPLSETSRGYIDTCLEKLGFVPNVLKAYAFDEGKLSAFIAMHDDLMLGDSGLSKLEREMIAVVVSAANRCHYCLVAHGAAVRKRSGDPALGEFMVMSYRAADLTPRHRAMLDFAWRLTSEPFAVGDADRAALRAAGFSDRDIWDIAAVAGFFNMSNRVATATGMKPNEEYTYSARSPAALVAAAPPPRPAAAPRRTRKTGAPGTRRRREID